jgi:hypothetical protein
MRSLDVTLTLHYQKQIQPIALLLIDSIQRSEENLARKVEPQEHLHLPQVD